MSSYVREGKTGYFISYEDRRRLQEFVDRHATGMMTRKFGRQIEDINHWNTLARRMELVRWKFIGFTIFGWLAALALAVITLIR